MNYVFPPATQPALPVLGQDALFPVRRIFCVGRNYAEHTREMGGDPDREAPFFFTKPADALVQSGTTIAYPPQTDDLHHEAELVIAICTGGADISVADALAHVFGYAAGNDLTRRDLQAAAKAARRPWDMAKGFDNSAVVSALRPGSTPPEGEITCKVDGQVRQDGQLADMIWPVADIIAFLSQTVRLAPGDLIMTGTPAGVGPLLRGETCVVAIAGLPDATVSII